MAWTGHIGDEEAARRANMSVHQAASLLGLVNGDLTSLAAAQAACEAGQLLDHVADRLYAVHSSRALQVGDIQGADVTASSLSTFYSALPDAGGHELRMIS